MCISAFDTLIFWKQSYSTTRVLGFINFWHWFWAKLIYIPFNSLFNVYQKVPMYLLKYYNIVLLFCFWFFGSTIFCFYTWSIWVSIKHGSKVLLSKKKKKHGSKVLFTFYIVLLNKALNTTHCIQLIGS